MRDFSYVRPDAEDDALALAAGPASAVIAGGTELLNWMRLGIEAPEQVVDIGRLARRAEIARDGETLHIGALATLNQVGEHPEVRAHLPGLADACLAAASAQLRNRATLGGNVLQRTRCPYFRAESPLSWGCNKREPGSGCGARTGLSDELAIFGATEQCAATHPSDPLVALACLDAEVELAATDGTRRIAVRTLHLTQREAAQAGRDPARAETTLRHGEVIVGYRLPIVPGARSAYVKVRERRSYAYAIVSAAASVVLVDGVLSSVRVALGSVAQRPWRLTQAEAALVGQPPEKARLRAAFEADLAAATPLPDNVYKVRLAQNTAVRAILHAAT